MGVNIMNKKNDSSTDDNTNYFRLIKNNIAPLDLFIIRKLNEGLSLDEIVKEAKNEFNIKNLKSHIKQRMQKLLSESDPEDKIILTSTPQHIINPAKAYDNIFLVFIKANLDSPQQKNLDIGLQHVFQTIIDLNNKPRFKKPIKQLYTLTSGSFDFLGIVYENNIKRFHQFNEFLLNEEIARDIDVIPVDTDSAFLFNPISIPDYKDFKQFLIHYRDRMDLMIDDITKQEINATKTMRFFEKQAYALKAMTGKDKGEIYPLDAPELKIGRYYDNDLIIQDIIVSRRHAKISKIDNQYIFKDLSTNGSYINEKKIIYDEIILNDGDIITIGKMKYKFEKISIDKKSS
ncbi:MAG: hypothetical protein DRN27_09300 [Thermoplasmata archaeon]|nr:MAG: hypothetical protein DRN27_09300 [Thermoplasmata archaeon]